MTWYKEKGGYQAIFLSIQIPFLFSFMVFNPFMLLVSSCPLITMTSLARVVNKYPV